MRSEGYRGLFPRLLSSSEGQLGDGSGGGGGDDGGGGGCRPRRSGKRKGNRLRAHASASDAPTTPSRSVSRGPSRVSCRSLRSDQRQTLRQFPARSSAPHPSPRVQPAIFRPATVPFVFHSGGAERAFSRRVLIARITCASVCVRHTRGDRKWSERIACSLDHVASTGARRESSRALPRRDPRASRSPRCETVRVVCNCAKNFIHRVAASDDLGLARYLKRSLYVSCMSVVCQQRKATVPTSL